MGKDIDRGETRRNFLKKAGKFAIYTPPALMVMSNASAKYVKATTGNLKCNNGWGNGDQCAPGNSLNHNNAENSKNPNRIQRNFGPPNPN